MRGPRRFGRAARACLAAAVAAVTMAACATVPTAGPVVPGDGNDSGNDPYGGYVRRLPAGPQIGVGPEGLVNGLLKDMGSFEEDYEAAREYMLPETGQAWSPDGTVKVFPDLDTIDMDTETSADGLTATVRMRSSLVATIDEDGRYLPGDPERLLDETFHLAREEGDPEGEWRIQSLPDQLILSQLDVERTHRPFNLYFFNPEETALVPDPVYLPVSTDELAKRLLRRLVGGPSDWLEPAVSSSFPQGASSSFDVDDDRVVVRVSAAGEPDEFGMGAQIAWTLRQLPEIQEFTLVVNGSEVDFPGAEGERADRPRPGSHYWYEVNPGATRADIRAYYSHEGQLWSASDWDSETLGDAERVPGPLGSGEVPLEGFAVSLDEERVAGVTAGGGEVVTSRTSPGAAVEEVLADGTFTELSWDVNGNLWVVEEIEEPDSEEDAEDEEAREEAEEVDPETPGLGADAVPDSTVLWLLRGGEEVVRVNLTGLGGGSLVRFQISRDGTRAAVVTEVDGQRSLRVGRVVEDADGRVHLGSFITLARELVEITDVSWRSADQLVVLGSREGGTSQAFLVSLDGGTPSTSAGAPVASMVTVSGAPGQPLVAGSDDGNIWLSNDLFNWETVVEGGSPSYPG
ncbi:MULTISPECIES: LpqB family beta-propeller domain-containing protein [unclassified Nocardiopsis]|uniref:LpqB family beta-propeller domain-containing protein n=1 Tax=unclassified Nocardiopsis TaxID=2649073 RepID=UPI001358EA21|nr:MULTISPECIES: LpqB family beta-propeller domain-containing protein [unclassified Nocardiopsis]